MQLIKCAAAVLLFLAVQTAPAQASQEYEPATETATQYSEIVDESADLEHCIVITRENVGKNVYFPEVPEIAGYTSDDLPVDSDGNQIYGWALEETGYSFKFFDDDGNVLYTSNQNEVAMARSKGTSHISLYLNYPGAGSRDGYYGNAYLYFHFVSKETHLEYAFQVPYLTNSVDIRIPAGMYEECFVTASEGIVLPDDYFFPSTCYVEPMRNSHMDFFASTIQVGEEVRYYVTAQDPNSTIVLGEADPMTPTLPTSTAVQSSQAVEKDGVLEQIKKETTAETEGQGNRLNTATLVVAIVIVLITFLLLASCIYGMHMYRGRRKEKGEK